MATMTNRNGVDVDRLVATVGAVQADPNAAKFTFRARSSWESGGRNKGEIRDGQTVNVDYDGKKKELTFTAH